MKKVNMCSIGFWFIVFAGLALAPMKLQAQTARGGGVSPESLPGSLKKLDIKDYFVSSSFKKAGAIHTLKGHVVVVHKATGEAYFGMEGDTIYENDSMYTLDNSRCRIKLLTRDVVTMAPDTEVSVDTFLDQRKEGKKTSIFSMAKGMVKFYALRLLRYKEAKFNVKTPTAVVGVRGTEFILHVYPKESGKVAGAVIMVADSGDNIATYLAAHDSNKIKLCTNIFVKDGEVGFNGINVRALNKSICGHLPEGMSIEEWFRENCHFSFDGCAEFADMGPKGKGPPNRPLDFTGGTSQKNVRNILDGFKKPCPQPSGT